ncbi:hypothetical protein FNU76_17665 [Chitinimonas arctica]|uniref:DUF4328 domain-containing protein n=1 Tax=Chitinimonas arctica TaxID=2594795 RepID=A0A516SIP0_9NEIS|nr:hypothetical protein [Chitinimonas arctica]QDQ28025.1 hypothetical protein FNU76_17665 [Chitinimonas arctica]
MNDAQAAGMFAGMGLLFIGVLVVALIPAIFYCLTLHRTMNKLSPANRPFEGALIWLSFIPVLGSVWHMVYVCLMSSAIKKEYADAGQQDDGAMNLAIGMVASSVACMIPFLNLIAWIPALVFWIMYWLRMADYNKKLPVAR